MTAIFQIGIVCILKNVPASFFQMVTPDFDSIFPAYFSSLDENKPEMV